MTRKFSQEKRILRHWEDNHKLKSMCFNVISVFSENKGG